MFLPLCGCLTLDSFVYSNVPCSEVSESTCEATDVVWDQVCATCEEAYAWDREYPWEPGTLAEGETITPIDPALVQQHAVATDDGLGTLDLYFIPAAGGDPDLATTTVLYQHGTWAGIEPYVSRVQMLSSAGFNVLVWDYRGYGKSLPAEAPTPEELMADAVQIRALADTLVPDPRRIVLYGYSLGGLPTVEMSVRQPGCATLLEAPFTSMGVIARSNSGASMGEQFFSEGRFDNVRKIASYGGPLFTFVGTEDKTLPPEDVRLIHDAAPGVKEFWLLDGAEHGVGYGVPETAGYGTYIGKIKTFLEVNAPECLGE
jgi:pimeloyl-ACP methyl ester carboxylesterase